MVLEGTQFEHTHMKGYQWKMTLDTPGWLAGLRTCRVSAQEQTRPSGSSHWCRCMSLLRHRGQQQPCVHDSSAALGHTLLLSGNMVQKRLQRVYTLLLHLPTLPTFHSLCKLTCRWSQQRQTDQRGTQRRSLCTLLRRHTLPQQPCVPHRGISNSTWHVGTMCVCADGQTE